MRNLAEEMVRNGIEVGVIGVYENMEESKEELIEGVRVRRLNLPGKTPGSLLQRLFRERLRRKILSDGIEQWIGEEGFTLVESYEWSGPLYRKPTQKLLVRLHGGHYTHAVSEGKRSSRLLAYWEKKNLRFADQIVSVSQHMQAATERAFGKLKFPKVVIYNSVNTIKFCAGDSSSRDPYKLLFVGKYHERKGVRELFIILSELFTLDERYHFEFVGPINEEQKTTLLSILPTALHERVKFTGQVSQDELPAIYAAASLMIMPTLAEAFGLTTVEAMASGCIVAMTDLPITHELFDDGISGLLIDLKNLPAAAQKIHSTLNDQQHLSLLRLKSVESVVNKFSNELIFKQNLNLYEQLHFNR